MSRDIFIVTTAGGRILLVSSAERPGMLLNIPQHTGQQGHDKELPTPNVNSAKVEEALDIWSPLSSPSFTTDMLRQKL